MDQMLAEWRKYVDVVLRRDETAAGQIHKFARFVEVYNYTGRMIQLADIEYKLAREERFRVTTRPTRPSESLDKFKVEFKLALGCKRGSQMGPSCEKNRR